MLYFNSTNGLYYEENKPTAQYYPYISFTFERETE